MNVVRLLRRLAPLALPILLVGCSLSSESSSGAIDPPQSAEVTTPTVEGSEPMTVFLQDKNHLLAPVTMMTTAKAPEEVGKQAVETLVEAGKYAKQLPVGFTSVLPQGTEVKSFTVDAQTKSASLNLSKSFVDYAQQDERKMLEALAWTITSVPGIESVQLMLEGEPLVEMPVAGLPISTPLTKAVGINLETVAGVNVMNSTPVTLYFSAITPDGKSYFVPVTRLIDRADNKAKAAMQQLIAGPLNEDTLAAIATPDLVVQDVVTEGDYTSVMLEDKSYKEGEKLPAEMMQAVILSMTENTGLDKVQISMNGQTNIIDTHDQSYSAPVSRPTNINALSL